MRSLPNSSRILICAAVVYLLAGCRGLPTYTASELSTLDRRKIWTMAEEGNPHAQFEVGMSYLPGDGVQTNVPEAVEWLTKAAQGGQILAQYNLGKLYSDGREVEMDCIKAVQWFHRAAARGFNLAQYELGLLYEQGCGTHQDYGQAAIWFRRAAEQGNGEAQFQLGLLYESGRGVSKNYVLAYKWFLCAARTSWLDERIPKEIAEQVHFLEQHMNPAEAAEGQALARSFIPHSKFP